MKIMLKTISTVLLISALLLISVEALEKDKKYNWYFKAVKNHEQPNFDVSLDELKQLDAYAIGSKNERVLYLTFDFGYENGNVKKCLDVLNQNNVKGTFFVLENVVSKDTALLKEMSQTGHTLANHTMKHKSMSEIKDETSYINELSGLEKLYEEKTGFKMSKFYRPPKGEFTAENLELNKKYGYKTIFWSLAYMDWDNNKQPDPTISYERLISRTHNGAVVLLHPTSATNAAILDKLIKEWKRLGYRFGSLDELK